MTNVTPPPPTAPAMPPVPAIPIVMLPSEKSFIITWLLALLVGFFGVDRFYLGKIGTGILKLITFGGFGLWVLIDLIIVLSGRQRDKQGRPLAGYAQYKKIAWIITGVVVVLSIILSRTGHSSTVEPAGASSAAPATTTSSAPTQSSAPAKSSASSVQSWADKTYGTFAKVEQSGTGDNIVTLPAGAKAGIVTATYDGSRNFSLSVLDANNASTGELLVNTIGAYKGTTAYGFVALTKGTTIQVTADSNWTISITPISSAPTLAASGLGDGVFLYSGSAGKLTATHDGSRNFSVSEETGAAFHYGLLINTIGAYSGTVPLSSGPSVLVIDADGNWTAQAG